VRRARAAVEESRATEAVRADLHRRACMRREGGGRGRGATRDERVTARSAAEPAARCLRRLLTRSACRKRVRRAHCERVTPNPHHLRNITMPPCQNGPQRSVWRSRAQERSRVGPHLPARESRRGRLCQRCV
jgi:hypothetical protein